MRRLFFLAALLLSLAPRWAWATPPALDGVDTLRACGTGTPLVVNSHLTTSNTQDYVVVMVIFGATDAEVHTITDTAGLTFTRRAQLQDDGVTSDRQEEWIAPAASALTSDTITVTATTGGSCMKVMVVGISGAAWPVPFDPYYTWSKIDKGGTPQSFTTLGTDNFLLAFYQLIGCSGVAPTAGTGWTSIYNGLNDELLVEYKTVTSAQTGLSASVGTCSGNIQSSITDAFVSSAGLGSANLMTKAAGYVVLKPGIQMSKGIGYMVLVPGTTISKALGYVVMSRQTSSGGGGGSSGQFVHSFPP